MHYLESKDGLNESKAINREQELARFFASIEVSAYQMAHIAMGRSDDALDIVQDAMVRVVHKYRHLSEADLKPLFFKILQRCIVDWYRRQKVRNWFHIGTDEYHLIEVDYVSNEGGEQQLRQHGLAQQLEKALHQLPIKQQQCFLLRSLHGWDVRQTAEIMGIGEGSVKTHYSRARLKLRELLGDDYE